jgi:hypothetical protein
MAQDDKDVPQKGPFGAKSFTEVMDEQAEAEAQAAADAAAERDWELLDAQEKSKQLKPLFTNRIYAEPVGRNLRISFGERIGEETVFHSSIVMPLEEALQAGDLLFRMAHAGLAAQMDEYRKLIAEADKSRPNGENG